MWPDVPMVVTLIVIGWIVTGFAVGFYEVRRGHWHWLWLLGAISGPLAIPLARMANQDEPFIRPQRVGGPSVAKPSKAHLHVLVGVDGSEDSRAAAHRAASLLGGHVGRLTLATVLDYETMNVTSPGTLGSEDSVRERKGAESVLAQRARDLRPLLDWEPTTVLLPGRPSEALLEFARDTDVDIVAVGRRGRGLSRRLLGSCAWDLVRQSEIPVLVVSRDEQTGDQPAGADQVVDLARDDLTQDDPTQLRRAGT